MRDVGVVKMVMRDDDVALVHSLNGAWMCIDLGRESRKAWPWSLRGIYYSHTHSARALHPLQARSPSRKHVLLSLQYLKSMISRFTFNLFSALTSSPPSPQQGLIVASTYSPPHYQSHRFSTSRVLPCGILQLNRSPNISLFSFTLTFARYFLR